MDFLARRTAHADPDRCNTAGKTELQVEQTKAITWVRPGLCREGVIMETLRMEIKAFEKWLGSEEKSRATLKKYLRDVKRFCSWLANGEITKECVMEYKKRLAEEYKAATVNSHLVAINCFLQFAGRGECRVKLLKIQRQIFANEDREMTMGEYRRLVGAAGDTRIGYIIRTICGTGIRISELQYITVDALARGKAVVDCKNKSRIIFLPVQVQKLLRNYVRKNHITEGSIFVSRSGKPLDRSNIWREMKALCQKTGISSEKVFPHNLRHLFARTFYSLEKDIVRLADLLGHSSINTTRIYTIESGVKHRKSLEQVNCILFAT